MMTPEERAAKVLQDYRRAAGRPIAAPLFLGRAIADAIRVACAVAYTDAANTCDEWASEHTAEGYGKAELEGMARLLRLRATGEEIR